MSQTAAENNSETPEENQSTEKSSYEFIKDDKFIIKGPDGNTYNVDMDLAYEVLTQTVEEQLNGKKENVKEEKSSKEKSSDDSENNFEQLSKRMDDLSKSLENKEKQEQNRRSQEQFKKQLSEALEKHPGVSSNEKLSAIIETIALTERYQNPNKKIEDIVKDTVELITEGKTLSNEEYLRDKQNTARRTRSTSGLRSDSSEMEETEKFSPADVKSGAVRKSIAARLQRGRIPQRFE